ncbi:Thyroglobulin type-1 repeat protein, partial [Euroglyphus maynei]
SLYEKEFRKKCGQIFIDNFCEHVQCLSIESCPDGFELIENIVGRKCCPACVKLLDENDECIPESMSNSNDDQIERCKNGMICDHMEKRCRLPNIEQSSIQPPCLREYHNRWMVRQNKKFYIMSANNAMKSFFPIQYAYEQFLPHCTFEGNYSPKQPSRNKAYCVNPNDGKPTFGIIDSHRSINQTCKCSQIMQDKLALAIDRLNPSKKDIKLDKVITEFNSDTHMKCKFSGNFQEVQCINGTCLCVDEKNGQPLLDPKEILNLDWARKNAKILYQPSQPKYIRWESAVVYGALNRLVCFDEENQKKKLSDKPIEKSYEEECFTEVHRSNKMVNHFAKKGTTLDGLTNTKCGFDDNYFRVQCPDAACTCHDPDGVPIAPYRADSTLSQEMDCRCALEEYLSKTGKLPVGILRCNGMGNFKPMQCSSNGQICYCIDNNGARISERFLTENIQNFKLKTSGNYHIEDLCQIMQNTLSVTNNQLIQGDEQFCYDPLKKTFKLCDEPSVDHIFMN